MRDFIQSPTWVTGPSTWPSFIAFPGTVTWSWIGNGAYTTQTGVCMKCCNGRLYLKAPDHSIRP